MQMPIQIQVQIQIQTQIQVKKQTRKPLIFSQNPEEKDIHCCRSSVLSRKEYECASEMWERPEAWPNNTGMGAGQWTVVTVCALITIFCVSKWQLTDPPWKLRGERWTLWITGYVGQDRKRRCCTYHQHNELHIFGEENKKGWPWTRVTVDCLIKGDDGGVSEWQLDICTMTVEGKGGDWTTRATWDMGTSQQIEV